MKVVVVDKDMKEDNVLHAQLPDATVLLCHWHVIKYWKKKIRDKDFPKLTQSKYTHVEDLMAKCLYAKTRREYEQWRDEMYNTLGDGDIWDYFKKNWDSMAEMWCLYMRHDLPTLGNNTNNRVESFFGKVKNVGDSCDRMSQLLTVLFKMAKRQQQEYIEKRNEIGRVSDSKYDLEMNMVLEICSPFVAELIHPKYEWAMDLKQN